jgi:hypothetical protein
LTILFGQRILWGLSAILKYAILMQNSYLIYLIVSLIYAWSLSGFASYLLSYYIIINLFWSFLFVTRLIELGEFLVSLIVISDHDR